MLCTAAAFSQQHLHCGSDKARTKLFKTHPEVRTRLEQHEEQLKNKSAHPSSSMVYTVPVVFHILHKYGAENISDAQVHDAMEILNRDFAKQNSDTTLIIPSFKPIADSTGIYFKLATIDPNGNCTNGITRHYSTDTEWDDESPTLYSQSWDPTKYMNIYVVKSIVLGGEANAAAGYTYLPGSWGAGDPEDAIVVIHSYIGSIGTGTAYTSRVLTHEVGHWLNLEHTFGWGEAGSGDCNTDDHVDDTPTTAGFIGCPNVNNPSSYQLCTPGVSENFQNYMDYSYCNKMFTHDQATRMRDALLDNISGRDNLWPVSNLAATGVTTPAQLCTADFKSNNTTNTVCEGNSLTFTDLSWNGVPATYNWSFPGGSPATSPAASPVITYNTAGVYSVSLTVVNGSGTVSTTKTNYVTVNPSTAVYAVPAYSESFESSTILNTDWKVRNRESDPATWVQTPAASVTGNKSVRIVNSADAAGFVDELISPSFNIDSISGINPQLTFKVAHAQKTSQSADKLQVFVSIDCGINWVLRKTISGANLSTAGIQSSSFIPTASQWAQQSVSLTGYSTQHNLFVMFRFTSDGGNNIYIDDINISGTSTASINEENSNPFDFTIYPNPADKNATVNLALTEKQSVILDITDITGKKLATLFSGEMNAGEHTVDIMKHTALSQGVYFVNLYANNKHFTKKLVVH